MFAQIFSICDLDFKLERGEARILLVDHNVEQASLIVNKLGSHFTIEVCDNLVIAFLKILENDYSLLIINIEVTNIKYVEWCINFKYTAPLKHLPLILLINRDDQDKLGKNLKMRIHDYALMPIGFNEFLTKINLQIRNFKYQEKLRAEYIKVYITDILTGLYNRKYLEIYFSDILKAVQSKKDHYILCLLDIDDFKKVNDNYGHATGDRVLQYISKTILENVRNSDFVARFGGEEFIIVFHKLTIEKVKIIVERIRGKLLESSSLGIFENNKIRCTISVGIDKIRPNDVLQSVLDRVDKKLYKAKSLGKNRVIS